VNEFRVGGTGGATLFSPELEPSMFAGRAGIALNFSARAAAPASAHEPRRRRTRPAGTANSAREASTKVIEDNATWLQGKHSFTFGGTMLQADVWLENQTLVPTTLASA
jgi:hypothetical protein